MPRYSYKCEKCDDAFEAYHGMGEKLVRCEKCDTTLKTRRSTTIQNDSEVCVCAHWGIPEQRTMTGN